MTSAGRRVSLVLATALVLAVVWAGTAAAQGILNTRHNLSNTAGATNTGNTQGDIKASGTTEVCVFCHTPHGADTTASAPLWNRAIPTSAGYTLYTSPNDSLNATVGQPDGVSLVCLSCHDGTIAFDAIRNLPGSGGWDNSPATNGTQTAWTFSNAGTGKVMPARTDTERITNIGTNLSDDHPISMTYADAASPGSNTGDDTFAAGFQATPLNGVRLYSGKVQCASCHDPHRSDTPTFLRVSQAGSGLCVSCHKKNVD